MEVLGHPGIAIAMNIYTHVLPTLASDEISGMGELLR